MESGMLWFDNDQKTDLPAKLKVAANYYRKKYGCKPDICYVHPSMLPAGLAEFEGIRLCSSPSIVPYHFWIGVHLTEQVYSQKKLEPDTTNLQV